MPIITPAYPAMCATHNVTASTQMIITEEFKKGPAVSITLLVFVVAYQLLGADIVDKVIIGKASWSELFEKHDFFTKYRYYLQVIASTVNPDVQLKWCVLITLSNSLETLSIARSGTVESRIRQLVMKLEYVDSLTLAHPFVKGFDQASYCLSEEELRTVAQGEIPDAIAKRKKEDIEGKEGASPVYSTTFFIGLAIEPKPRKSYFSSQSLITDSCFEAGAVGPRRLDISYPTTEFSKLVKVWEHYNEATMGIVVRHIKRFAVLLA